MSDKKDLVSVRDFTCSELGNVKIGETLKPVTEKTRENLIKSGVAIVAGTKKSDKK